MTDTTDQASDNLTDYYRYQSVIMPLVAEMAAAVDLDEATAEIQLDAGDAPSHQLDLVLGMIQRFKEMNQFLADSYNAVINPEDA